MKTRIEGSSASVPSPDVHASGCGLWTTYAGLSGMNECVSAAAETYENGGKLCVVPVQKSAKSEMIYAVSEVENGSCRRHL